MFPPCQLLLLLLTSIFPRLFGLAVEDAALEDTIYALDEALQAGRIADTTYVKQVRSLSRQQFLCRALGIKITSAPR